MRERRVRYDENLVEKFEGNANRIDVQLGWNGGRSPDGKKKARAERTTLATIK
jgi:hypothetical protein